MQFLNDESITQWSARRGDRLLGVASLEPNKLTADNLWLAFPPNPEEDALFAPVDSRAPGGFIKPGCSR